MSFSFFTKPYCNLTTNEVCVGGWGVGRCVGIGHSCSSQTMEYLISLSPWTWVMVVTLTLIATMSCFAFFSFSNPMTKKQMLPLPHVCPLLVTLHNFCGKDHINLLRTKFPGVQNSSPLDVITLWICNNDFWICYHFYITCSTMLWRPMVMNLIAYIAPNFW